MSTVFYILAIFLLFSCSSSRSLSNVETSKSNNSQSVEKKPVLESKNTISNDIKSLKKDEIRPARSEEIRVEKNQKTSESKVPDSKVE